MKPDEKDIERKRESRGTERDTVRGRVIDISRDKKDKKRARGRKGKRKKDRLGGRCGWREWIE